MQKRKSRPKAKKLFLADEMNLFVRRIARGDNGCWIWVGAKHGYGYGWFRDELAHRASLRIFKGYDTTGMFVCHKCDNPPCVNPAHLFLGTPKDNIDDMIKKGRNFKGPRTWLYKISDAEVVEIWNAYYRDGEDQQSIAVRYSIAPCHVSFIVNRKTRKHVTKNLK